MTPLTKPSQPMMWSPGIAMRAESTRQSTSPSV